RAALLSLALVAYGNAKSWYDLVVLHTTAAGSTFGVGAGVAIVLAILTLVVVLGVEPSALGLAGGSLHSSLRLGLRVGAMSGGLAAILTIVGALLGLSVTSVTPAARVPWDELLWRAGLLLWVDTAVPEELAFRGGLLAALGGPARSAVLWSGVAFAAWHVVVVLQDGPAEWWVYVGKLLAIGVGGLLFGWLRAKAGNLLAPIVAHWLFDFASMLAARLAVAL